MKNELQQLWEGIKKFRGHDGRRDNRKIRKEFKETQELKRMREKIKN